MPRSLKSDCQSGEKNTSALITIPTIDEISPKISFREEEFFSANSSRPPGKEAIAEGAVYIAAIVST